MIEFFFAGVHLETQWGGEANLQKNWGAIVLRYTNPKLLDISKCHKRFYRRKFCYFLHPEAGSKDFE